MKIKSSTISKTHPITFNQDIFGAGFAKGKLLHLKREYDGTLTVKDKKIILSSIETYGDTAHLYIGTRT